VETFLLTLVAAAAVAMIGFGIVAFTLGNVAPAPDVQPDRRHVELPRDRPVEPGDIAALRFDVGLRGYRMDEVDAVLDRLCHDLQVRDEQVSALAGELARLRGQDPGAEDLPDATKRTQPSG